MLDAQELIASHAQLVEQGMPKSSIMHRIRPDGPWQRLLPGVVLAHRGSPTRREKLLGAVAYAGDTAVISGSDALVAAGVKQVELTSFVLVLVPANQQRKSFNFVQIERTTRPPEVQRRQGLAYASAPRAVIDMCRHQSGLNGVRSIVASAVQQQRCRVETLGVELTCAPRQRSAGARRALAEVGNGVRSVAEAQAREILERAAVPQPVWNAEILDAQGMPILRPDAWWPELRAALEIDSRKWHLSPEDWSRTQRRQRLLTAQGILVMSFSPTEIIQDPQRFVSEVKGLLKAAK